MKKCHLSGLIIKEESESKFILIPMAYKISQTNFLTYLTSESVYPLSLPIITNNLYDNDDKDNVILNIFKAELSNNTNGKYYSLNSEEIEYLTDSELFSKVENKETVSKINLSSNLARLTNIFKINNNSLLRLGYILIDQDFLNVLIDKNYSDYKLVTESNISNLISKYNVSENNFKSKMNISMSELHNALGLRNEEYSGFENILVIINNALKCYNEKNTTYDSNFQKIVDSLVLMSLIYRIYNDLGKSFYPKISNNYSNKLINRFSGFVEKYAEKKSVDSNGNYFCHLSRTPIEEDDKVICIPVKYGDMDTNLYYVTSNEVTPCFVPFNASYNGNYGIKEEENIVNSLFSKYLKRESEPKFNRYGIDESAEYKDSISLLKNLKEDKYEKKEIVINNFHNYISLEYNVLLRHGYLLINKDFFDKYVNKNYTAVKKEIYNNLINVVMKDKERVEMPIQEEDYYERQNKIVSTQEVRKALMFFNGSDESISSITLTLSHLRSKYKEENIDLLNNNKFIDTINGLVDLGLITMIYHEIGKSFYPELNRVDVDKLIEYNNTLSVYSEEKAKSLEKDYGNNKWFI